MSHLEITDLHHTAEESKEILATVVGGWNPFPRGSRAADWWDGKTTLGGGLILATDDLIYSIQTGKVQQHHDIK